MCNQLIVKQKLDTQESIMLEQGNLVDVNIYIGSIITRPCPCSYTLPIQLLSLTFHSYWQSLINSSIFHKSLKHLFSPHVSAYNQSLHNFLSIPTLSLTSCEFYNQSIIQLPFKHYNCSHLMWVSIIIIFLTTISPHVSCYSISQVSFTISQLEYV